MTGWLDWLSTLPSVWLYTAMVIAAFAENIFPPLPADTVVALGAFVAARHGSSAVAPWAATMVGNVGGAMCMYALGRRIGTTWLSDRFPRTFPPTAIGRLSARFQERGIVAIAVSRFLPAVRAIVPPVAGAMRLGAGRVGIAMAVASGVWYGIVCVVAYRAGANAEAMLAMIARQQRLVGIAALGLLVIGLGIWRLRKGRPV
jgi:membrane protein DedA with SNARE-associated domain